MFESEKLQLSLDLQAAISDVEVRRVLSAQMRALFRQYEEVIELLRQDVLRLEWDFTEFEEEVEADDLG